VPAWPILHPFMGNIFKTLDTDVTMSQLQQAAQRNHPVYINFSAHIQGRPPEDLMQVLSMMQRFALKQAHILLSSDGGSVLQGFELHNFLRSMPIEISMHNTANVDSIANTVFLAANRTNRTAEPNAHFLFHGVSTGLGRGKEADIQAALLSVRRDQTAIAETLSRYTNMTLRDIRRACKSEIVWTAEQAKNRGIIRRVQRLRIPENAEVINIFDPPEEKKY